MDLKPFTRDTAYIRTRQLHNVITMLTTNVIYSTHHILLSGLR